MKTSSRERDPAYGAAMLGIRTKISLSRAELASYLGVSLQTVGAWEMGRSYPKAEHLKELIALAVQKHAFTAEHEAEEIHALWRMARQKVLLNENWLSALLSERPPYLQIVPAHVDTEQASMDEPISIAPVIPFPVPKPWLDWGDALTVPIFCGREQELALLSQWIVQEDCRVVSVLGMGGIGKSALAVRLMYQLATGAGQAQGTVPTVVRGGQAQEGTIPTVGRSFEVVIFRSLRDAPSCEALLDDCLQVLSPVLLRVVPATLEQRISLLLSHLHERRVLVVLDNLECLLETGDVKGHFCPGFEGYGQLLHRIAESGHQSCLLFTSREKPTQLGLLESKYPSVRSLQLAGLDAAACQQLLDEKELIGTEAEQEQLIEIYAGNPLALMIVAETIIDLFRGAIGEFLAQGAVLFGSITELLDEQFARLSALEQSVLYWLAIVREPVTLDEMLSMQVNPLSRVRVLEAVNGLRRRSLIERGKRTSSFTLQSVVLEYVTAVLIARGSQEIQQRRLDLLIQHSLSQATAREYVRQTQERLLLFPLLADLQSAYWRQDNRTEQVRGPVGQAQGLVPTEEQLLSLLDHLREQSDTAQGYGPANLITLLRLQRGHLSALNLSHLSIRGAYLQSIKMQDTSLAGSWMCDTAFTEAVSAVRAVAISPDGKWWAAGGMQGKVRVWEEGGQTLQWIWQAHTDMVYSLVFSPDGRTLASAGRDGTIKLWDLDRSHWARPNGWACPDGALIWIGRQNIPVCLAFTPDSSLLTSAGVDGTVRLWDTQSGTNVQALEHPGQVYTVTWSPDGHLLASGGSDGAIRLCERKEMLSFACIEIHTVQSNWVMSLAFAPDGKTLASGHRDQTVKLWEMGSLRLLHTLSGHTDRATVVWSPDGRILASCNTDKMIWLWNVDQGCYRGVLHGHTADINAIAFTPDGSRLLSSSEDGTLRVWDVESCQCVRVITGYAVSLCDIDWSPDGTHLVSGGSDGLVTVWDLSGGKPLDGHGWIVSGVGWSSDGKLASCGWDRVMRLWDPALKTCVQMFHDPPTPLLSIAWSLDGRLLACGTYLRGMQVWDMNVHCLRWVGLPYQIAFYKVAWSPDGTRLVGSGGDGSIYLWEVTSGTLLEKLSGHQGRVTSVVWSPDGRFLASANGGGGRGELFVWDMQHALSGSSLSQPVRTFAGHPGIVSALVWTRSDALASNHNDARASKCSHGACSCGADLLISGCSDGMLRWWDVQSGECVSTQAAHDGTIQSLRISPDGQKLASCGDDGAIRIWDLCSGGQAQGAAQGTESVQGTGSTQGTTPTLLQTLQRDRPYERLNITGIRGLTEAQKATLRALGAIEES